MTPEELPTEPERMCTHQACSVLPCDYRFFFLNENELVYFMFTYTTLLFLLAYF